MEFLDRSNDICVFCYKINDTKTRNFDGNKNVVVGKFVNILERFSSLYTDQNGSIVNNNNASWTGCCKLCRVIVNDFCDEYHQLKCLEMRMEWKLEGLLGIMELAGRVPSRWFKLQEIFSQSEKSMANLKRYRQQIMQTCSRRISRAEPRILLKRLCINDYPDLPSKAQPSVRQHDENEVRPHFATPVIHNAILEPQETKSDNTVNKKRIEIKIKLESDFNETRVHSESEETTSSDDPHSPDPDFEVGVKSEPEEDDISSGELCEPNKIRKFPRSRKTFRDKYRKIGTKFHCDQCDSMFSTVQRLKVHQRRVHLGTPVKCPVCQKVLKHRQSLKAHMVIHTDPSTWKYKCDSCGKGFDQNVWLTRHKTLCGANPSLKHHSLKLRKPVPESEEDRNKYIVHPPASGEKTSRFECKECGKIFRTKNDIRYHLFTHRKGEPLICQHCGVTCPHSRSLQRHVRKHHMPKGKKFPPDSGKYFLHLGEQVEKKYKCNKCGKMWRNMFQLNRHRLTHEKAEQLVCQFCGKKFARNVNLRKHVQKLHSNMNNKTTSEKADEPSEKL